MQKTYTAHTLVPGTASGPLLYSSASLSFWGGINVTTGDIIDHHHPLRGMSLAGKVLAIPSGRGSCTGSGALLELLVNGVGPVALVFKHAELILTLGVIVAKALFDREIPVVVLGPEEFAGLEECGSASVCVRGGVVGVGDAVVLPEFVPVVKNVVRLSERDQDVLGGSDGAASRVAMEILVEFAQAQGAEELLDVTQAHVDACIYVGPTYLAFAQKMLSLGAKFAVPTTMNSISLDYRRWNELGVDAEATRPASALADAYMAMGATMSFTCAPYLLESAPTAGQQIGWSESNAVVFANSVIGARTQKYPDFLEVCIALTGRAPLSGCHLDKNRKPRLVVTLPQLTGLDDSAYPVIGYLVGQLSGSEIPLICGLQDSDPSTADLKAFSAAFATTASAPMFHIEGVTPESEEAESCSTSLERITVSIDDLLECHRRLNTACDKSVDLISLGNPHFAIEEFAMLAGFCLNRQKHSKVKVVVTTSRAVQEKAYKGGYLDTLFNFGAEVITDTCWCMLDEPVIPVEARNLMTNSAKYAHYAPAIVRRGVHFGNLAQCVEAACTGEFVSVTPSWLSRST